MTFFRSVRWTTLAIGALVLAGCSRSLLKEGDRIIFLGDSITAQGNDPGGYVSIVRDTLLARRPELGLEIIGAGISGNKVPDLQARLQRDVLDRNPTMVFIYIGINDVWHSLKPIGGTPLEVYEAGLKEIIARLQEAGAQVFLCTPTVIGERHDDTNALDTPCWRTTPLSAARWPSKWGHRCWTCGKPSSPISRTITKPTMRAGS